MSTRLALVLCAIVALVHPALGRHYASSEKVDVQVSTVGPYHNLAERFYYYDLPVCDTSTSGIASKAQSGTFGDSLSGNLRMAAPHDIRFGVDVQFQVVCPRQLNQDDIMTLRNAIEADYMFKMFVDDLPVIGFFGEKEEKNFQEDHKHVDYFLFTHIVFSISYNKDTVIACNISTDPDRRVALEFGKNIDVEYSFSVFWTETHVVYDDRMSLHAKPSGDDHFLEIHWLSIINSFVLVVLLMTFLTIILMRVLRNDFARYSEADTEEMGNDIDDSGWKQIHGDVFRFPSYPMLFSSIVGTGIQILALCICLLFLALVGVFYRGNHNTLYTTAVFLYAATAGIAGYISTTLYVQIGGTKWATNAVCTSCLFAVPFLCTFAIVNTTAILYNSTSAVPALSILFVIAVWGLVTFPLTLWSASKAQKNAKKFDAPCKTNRVAREIPAAPWYQVFPAQIFMAGFLPFSAIYIELHYIFSSVWGHRVYTLFGMLALAFLMLILVTAFITVALTYFQLAIEDHRWWWRSLLSGGSTGFFVYGYAIFFYVWRSPMNGILQGVFFFGYMLMISYGFFLMLGAIGFASSLPFVKYIYRSIKSD